MVKDTNKKEKVKGKKGKSSTASVKVGKDKSSIKSVAKVKKDAGFTFAGRQTMLPSKIISEFLKDCDDRKIETKGKTGEELFAVLSDIEVLKAIHFQPTIADLQLRILEKIRYQLSDEDATTRDTMFSAQALACVMRNLRPDRMGSSTIATQVVVNNENFFSSDMCTARAIQANAELKMFRQGKQKIDSVVEAEGVTK